MEALRGWLGEGGDGALSTDSGSPVLSLPEAVGRGTEYRLSLEGTEDEVLP